MYMDRIYVYLPEKLRKKRIGKNKKHLFRYYTTHTIHIQIIGSHRAHVESVFFIYKFEENVNTMDCTDVYWHVSRILRAGGRVRF